MRPLKLPGLLIGLLALLGLPGAVAGVGHHGTDDGQGDIEHTLEFIPTQNLAGLAQALSLPSAQGTMLKGQERQARN
jgi:hypothetical protein